MALKETYMLVELSQGVRALCPALHFADVTLSKPEKKFKVGKQVKVCVLKVDPKTGKITVTHKRTMVKSELPRCVSRDIFLCSC